MIWLWGFTFKGEGGLIILEIDRLGKVLEGIQRRRDGQREREIKRGW